MMVWKLLEVEMMVMKLILLHVTHIRIWLVGAYFESS